MERRSRTMSNLSNYLFQTMCYLSVACGLSILCLLFYSLISHGWHSLNIQLFTHTTNPPGQAGGLKNAIIGSSIIITMGILISIPWGIGSAIYLAFYGKRNKIAYIIRNTNDILMTTPSIILGLFVCAILVNTMHHYSAIAGSIALALISMPIICRTTEDMLYLVSPTLREAGLALGIKDWIVILKIILVSARTGICTGIILALARITGETAPLLFTSLSSNFTNFNILHPMASLPIVIYQYAMSPYQSWQNIAWSGALLITLAILLINITAKYIDKRNNPNNKRV